MKKTVRDIDVGGKKCLVRCDFNVPMQDGEIHDDTRIKAAMPTIQYLKDHNARIILMSHMGRPKGEPKPEFTLAPVAARLAELLGCNVKFSQSDNVVDDKVKADVDAMKDGDIILLENTRYRAEETKNDPAFTKELASLGEIFVNDAFGTAHRAHCSTAGLADFMPAVSGFLIEKEIKYLDEAVNDPRRPFVAILGGAKVADKIPMIKNLLPKVDSLLIGGGMAYTFLKGEGYEIGTSLLDKESVGLTGELLKEAEKLGKEIILPVDAVVAKEFDNDSERRTVKVTEMPEDMMGMDIGPDTAHMFGKCVMNAGTVVWNGPMGVFEMSNFRQGTKAVAEAMAESGAVTIIGGGDSASAAKDFGLADRMTHISTGGGASLEYLEGKTLPGVACLEDK